MGSDYNPACAEGNSPDQLCLPFNGKFPYLSNIFQMGNVYRSNYNGLQVTLNARNYHGLSMVAGYTYSHASDDVGANWDFGYGSGLPQNAHNVAAEYANSDFDIRHRLTVSLTYAIPGRKGFGQMREGWEINSIITLESPQFWGPMDEGTDAAGRWTIAGEPARQQSDSLELLPRRNEPRQPLGLQVRARGWNSLLQAGRSRHPSGMRRLRLSGGWWRCRARDNLFE